jgi:hypothetical protein
MNTTRRYRNMGGSVEQTGLFVRGLAISSDGFLRTLDYDKGAPRHAPDAAVVRLMARDGGTRPWPSGVVGSAGANRIAQFLIAQ